MILTRAESEGGGREKIELHFESGMCLYRWYYFQRGRFRRPGLSFSETSASKGSTVRLLYSSHKQKSTVHYALKGLIYAKVCETYENSLNFYTFLLSKYF